MTGRFDRFRAAPESVLVVAFFLLRPLTLLVWLQPTVRYCIIYGAVSPLIGLLLVLGIRRARFACYVFLSLELIRTTIAHQWVALAAAVVILAYLQLPRAKRVWPRIDPNRVAIVRALR